MSEKFRTVFDRVRTFSNSGSDMANDYKMEYGKDGRKKLVISGKHSLDDEIQMYKDISSIDKIVERYLNLGDPSVLDRRPVFYGDVTEMPQTYAELLQFNADMEKNFNSLPADVKNQFDNDLGQFIASIGTDKFNKVFGSKEEMSPAPVDVVKEGVVYAE